MTTTISHQGPDLDWFDSMDVNPEVLMVILLGFARLGAGGDIHADIELADPVRG